MSKQILFVDDEPSIRRIYEMLQPFLGEDYSVATACDGREALEFFRTHPVDVVVSDLIMPNMNGLELLSEVSREYPATPRVAVSGCADEITAARCLMLAHRYFTKPFDPSALAEVIVALCKTQRSAANDRIREHVGRIEAVPTLSRNAYLEVTKALRSNATPVEEVSTIIERDLALTAKVLQVVNCACFGSPVRVNTVFEAIQRIGFEVVRAMVLAIQVLDFCSHITKSSLFEAVWKHSLETAMNTRRLAFFEGMTHEACDEAFLVGLLHDIGKVVLACSCADYTEAWELHGRDSQALAKAETERFGADHGHVGAYLLRLWGLSPHVTDAVLMHQSIHSAAIDQWNPLLVLHIAQELSPSRSNSRLHRPLIQKLGLASRVPEWRKLFCEDQT